jgi:DNA repair protein RecN (Recombination protein N)
MTGETGAGKSIILGALGLILGQRAEISILKDKTKGCIVEGMFNISSYNLQPFFQENDLEYYDSTLIRRQITQTGKSRAFVNDIPVNLTLLKNLVDRIIDIHSQHENLLLSESSFQLSVVDSFANITSKVNYYNSKFLLYKSLYNDLVEIKQRASKTSSEYEYLHFQLNQLNETNLKSGEQQELEMLQQQLTHADEIKYALQGTIQNLKGEENSVIALLKEVESYLKKISSFFSPAEPISSRIESSRIELKDIADELEHLNERVELDPEQLALVNSRLDQIFSLLQKHRLNTVEELISLKEKLSKQVEEIENFDAFIEKKEKELAQVESELKKLAQEISSLRRKSTPDLEKRIIELLKQLGMPFASLSIEFNESEDFLPTGFDLITFLFSANKQMPKQELSKVASGGELSRLMLSLKSLLVKTIDLPTIIFDEIDNGVSGEVADKVGNIINNMASNMQVINITHLPQIACKGKYHFLVYKDNQSSTSKTLIKLLTKEERVVEIAKMLSGEKLSEAALTNAKHLLAENSD